MTARPIPQGMHSVTPHLVCAGAAQAIEFYKKAFGATEQNRMPGPGGKIMHAALRIGDTTIMASDGNCKGKPNFQGFSLSLSAPNEVEAERLFAVLGEGGQVQMPMSKTFFAPRFGMVADRFGVSWMVIVAT